MEKLTKEELAKKLTGNQYRDEISDELNEQARESGLLVIYGGSDDLLYLSGVGNDEIGCYGGGELIIVENGAGYIADELSDIEDKQILLAFTRSYAVGNTVNAIWCDIQPYSWAYETTLPHATFDIMEDDEKYCRGIVIDINDMTSIKSEEYTRVAVVSDEDGHWYVIPHSSTEQFHEMLANGEEDEWSAFEENFGDYRTGGDINNIKLYINSTEWKN